MLVNLLGCAARIVLACAAIFLATDEAFCQAAKDEIYSGSIPFESADRLDDYSVSGVWFPQNSDTPAGLSGPAIFVLKNANTGKQWTVAVNTIALLDKEFLDKHPEVDATQSDSKALVAQLTKVGIVSISLSKAMRAKVTDCGAAESAPAARKGKDQCLVLGDAIVDLQDVDFDGEKELVFRHAGMGQRHGDAYEVVRIGADDDFPESDSSEPFRDIDSETLINITRKKIIINGSGGACDSTRATYSHASGGMGLTHFWRTVMGPSDSCFFEDYAVESQVDGAGQRLKLLSRKKASNSEAPN